jgi:hypothetical protein
LRVFTSWNSPLSAFDRESLASLEVALIDEKSTASEKTKKDSKCYLKSHGWVNGVWCVRGKQLGTYGFPLPGIFEGPERNEELLNQKKWKRSDDVR